MRYAVDLGNSAAKAALLDGAVVRLPAPADPRDAVAWGGVAAELIAAIRADAERTGEAATLRVASVVPAGAEALRAVAKSADLSIEFVSVADVPLELALTPPAQIGQAFRLALGRPPSANEAEAMSGYVREHGLTNLCRLIFNLNEFNFVD